MVYLVDGLPDARLMAPIMCYTFNNTSVVLHLQGRNLPCAGATEEAAGKGRLDNLMFIHTEHCPRAKGTGY